MLRILLVTENPIRIQERTSGHVVLRINNKRQPRAYDVYCESSIHITDEPWYLLREDAFCQNVRARDGKCVISRTSLCGSWWDGHNYGAGLTTSLVASRNGFLLHSLFTLTRNKDNYKITVFTIDNHDIDGRTLDFVCRDPPALPANMNAAGEPIFERDFPPGMDVMREVREGPYGKERLEI
ncbi:hypothetical protein BDZ91DRAFT_777598 [Kalaharituber pfeilii]|nr:hypothetical protein BDZ91DRAFT_777598 [Kalaharituber pfeilii]